MSVPGSPTTATTSARTDGASLATTIVRTGVRLTGADLVGEDVVGDEAEPGDVVHVHVQQRHQ